MPPTKLQSWTTQQLINLSNSLARVYNANLAQTNASQDAWTTQQFISLSDVLAQAYCPGLK